MQMIAQRALVPTRPRMRCDSFDGGASNDDSSARHLVIARGSLVDRGTWQPTWRYKGYRMRWGMHIAALPPLSFLTRFTSGAAPPFTLRTSLVTTISELSGASSLSQFVSLP